MQLMRPYSIQKWGQHNYGVSGRELSQAKESEISRRAFILSRGLKQELGHIYANTGGRGAWTLWEWFPRKFRHNYDIKIPSHEHQTKGGLDRIRELN